MSLTELKRMIDNHSIISFDIYDTLLLRPYAKPVDMFIHLEHIHESEGYAYARLTGEQKARADNPDLEDITFRHIYRELGAKYSHMRKHEIHLEMTLSMMNPEMMETFAYAKSTGKRIVLITDMYLPRNVIETTLTANGYSGYEKLYISSEVGLMKYSGGLFRHAFEDLGIAPNEVLHIGDTYHSDISAAKACGADTYYYPKIIERLYAKNARAKVYHDRNPIGLGASITLGILALSHFRREQSYWWEFGYAYAGPPIFAFMCWLRREVKKKGIKKVLFVARDGYTPKKIFDLLCEGEGVETAYIYAPRNVTSFTSFNYEERIRHDSNAGLALLKRIIETYKDQDPVLYETAPVVETVEQGKAYIEAHKDRFARLAAKKSTDYGEYILPMLSDGPLALVDTLSIHLSSQKLVQKFANRKKENLHGFYWMLLEESSTDGCAVSAFQPERRWLTYDWDIFEFLMTSPEPSIKDFENGKPVYLDVADEEKYRQEIYPDVSDGAVEFAKTAMQALKGIDPHISNHDATDWINILCSHPTERDRRMMCNVKHMYDSNVNIFKPICKSWFTVRTYTRKYRLFNLVQIAEVSMLNDSYQLNSLGVIRVFHNPCETRLAIGGCQLYRRTLEKNNVSHYYIGRWCIFSTPAHGERV